MWRYFERKNTSRWVDIIEKLTKSYNNSIHRSIGRTPASITEFNVRQVWLDQFSQPNETRKLLKFTLGDKVRVSKGNYKMFKKGFQQQWSSEIFTVVQCIKRQPPVYRIEDLEGEEIKGVFYTAELQKIE